MGVLGSNQGLILKLDQIGCSINNVFNEKICRQYALEASFRHKFTFNKQPKIVNPNKKPYC